MIASDWIQWRGSKPAELRAISIYLGSMHDDPDWWQLRLLLVRVMGLIYQVKLLLLK